MVTDEVQTRRDKGFAHGAMLKLFHRLGVRATSCEWRKRWEQGRNGAMGVREKPLGKQVVRRSNVVTGSAASTIRQCELSPLSSTHGCSIRGSVSVPTTSTCKLILVWQVSTSIAQPACKIPYALAYCGACAVLCCFLRLANGIVS